MIIVSQDKDMIVNFNNVQYIERKDNYIYLRSTDDDFTIGDYKTKKRAKEVLQEIIDTYLGFPREKNNPLYLETRLALQGMVNNFITVPKIYYMPKE